MKRILIHNGLVYDGLGNPGQKADVLLKDGFIAGIGRELGNADIEIDAGGQVVCPGFVDIHRHHDAKPLQDPEFGKIELAQGITTAVCGNCGISMTPRPEEAEAAKSFYAFEEPVMGPIGLNGPHSYRQYLDALSAARLPLNMAAMVGTGAVRIAVKGFSDAPYLQQELDSARIMIEDALKAGAPGISLGIMYIPECYTTAEEYGYLLEPVGRYGRVITAHIRGEGDGMVHSVAEAIAIARRAGCALEISHFKSCGMRNWRRGVHEAIRLIEDARAEGMDVTVDLYPYDGGSTALTTMLPPAFVAGNMPGALKRLGTPEGVEEFRRLSSVPYEDWDNFCVTLGWDRIMISGVQPINSRFQGLMMPEAAERFGFEDAAALAAYLMHSEQGKTAIINMSMCQDDIDTVACLPYSSFISDAIYADTETPHPRMFGAFPKVIREYVGERRLLTLEEALRKMTSQPANRMGLKDRGRLTVGARADVLVFDPALFRDHATYANPAQMPTGLTYAIVNGQIAAAQDRRTESYAGALLRL